MCGICGIAEMGAGRRVNRKILISMRDSLSHRGPDDSGIIIKGQIGLGHRRLSIIDLDFGSQPMHNEDSSVWIVFNGEIYNYQELRDELEGKGHKFTTKSDTETLIHLYEEEGSGLLNKINGMFSFCIWDEHKKEFFLARDRMGQKPLYYSQTKETFLFASEIKALLLHPSVSREIDIDSLNKYLTFEYVPAPHSIIRNMHKLKPGYYLVFRLTEKDHEVHRYWDIPLVDDAIAHKTEQEYADDLVDVLSDSVRLRLRSDVPLGIFLSGGIDSSVITALSMEHVRKIQTFTVGFQEKSFDETRYAQEVSQFLGTEHHSEVLDLSKAYNLLPEIMEYLDEPLGDASIIPTFLLSRFTVQHVKVALSGEGGDELFAGYPTYQALKMINYYNIFPKEVRALIHKMAARLPVSHKNISFDFKVKQMLRGVGVSPEVMFFLWMGSFNEREKRELFLPDVGDILKRKNPYEDLFQYINESNLQKNFERVLYLSAKLYLQDDILVKVDRASMANSLEVRAPFLDYRFVEFAAGLPTVYKLNRLTMKYLLKKAFMNRLPKRIVKRKKKGFGIPVARWISEELQHVLKEYLNEDRIKKDGYFNPFFIKRLIDEHIARRKDNRKLLWTLLIFQMWKERWAA
ncbi:MAG: asparagine synthase (glutamine-hydrolyzing) [Candidatus Aminicenantes bacterium]|nr:asparagine synthase (glutamine-hydrolyzing) [Candidatus Aminicenantes bacterium]